MSLWRTIWEDFKMHAGFTPKPLAEGDTITLVVRKDRLEPVWWAMTPKGTEPFQRGYDAGFLDGIQLRYRAEQNGKVPQ